jgi:hypothetical protein
MLLNAIPKHTPGPWKSSPNTGAWSAINDGIGSSCYEAVKDAEGNVVALAVAHSPSLFADPDSGPNARLIAASPKLLAALQAAVAYLPQGHVKDNANTVIAEVMG